MAKIKLEGTLLQFDKPNKNGRIYTEDSLRPEVDKIKEQIRTSNFLGELGEPMDPGGAVTLGMVSHRVTDTWIDDKGITAQVEVLDGTPQGQILKDLLDNGIPLSLSARMMGKVNNGNVQVNEIISYDIIAGSDSDYLAPVKFNRGKGIFRSLNIGINRRD